MKRYGFQPFEWGIVKSWVYEDEMRREQEGWGNLLVFPTMLRLESEMHWRVPVDNQTTRIFILGFQPGDGHGDSTVETLDLPRRAGQNGRYLLDTFYSQDAMAWESAGEIFDRTTEHLGASDVGIVMFRRMLADQIERVEAGLEP
jgi:5,5'-dehydrodivanillate O-demethylase